MKKVVSAFAVLAVVGAALAFKTKAFVPGDIYCSATAPDPSKTCDQNFFTLVDFAQSTTGSLGNPCLAGQNPYITSGSTCIALPSTQHWVPTLEGGE